MLASMIDVERIVLGKRHESCLPPRFFETLGVGHNGVNVPGDPGRGVDSHDPVNESCVPCLRRMMAEMLPESRPVNGNIQRNPYGRGRHQDELAHFFSGEFCEGERAGIAPGFQKEPRVVHQTASINPDGMR